MTDYTNINDFKLGVEHLYKALKPFINNEYAESNIEGYIHHNEYGLALEILLDYACSNKYCIQVNINRGHVNHIVVLDDTFGGRIYDKEDI